MLDTIPAFVAPGAAAARDASARSSAISPAEAALTAATLAAATQSTTALEPTAATVDAAANCATHAAVSTPSTACRGRIRPTEDQVPLRPRLDQHLVSSLPLNLDSHHQHRNDQMTCAPTPA